MLQEDTRLPRKLSRNHARTPTGVSRIRRWCSLLPLYHPGHAPLRRQLLQPAFVDALFAVTAVLLGLACLNVSGLFLARGSARDREIMPQDWHLVLRRGESDGNFLPTAS